MTIPHRCHISFSTESIFTIKRHYLTIFLNSCKGRRAISLSCTLNAHYLPKYLYLNGKHMVDKQKKKRKKKISLSIKLVVIGKLSLTVHSREFHVGVFHHITVAFKQIATLSKFLIRHWAFSLLQKYYIKCK